MVHGGARYIAPVGIDATIAAALRALIPVKNASNHDPSRKSFHTDELYAQTSILTGSRPAPIVTPGWDDEMQKNIHIIDLG